MASHNKKITLKKRYLFPILLLLTFILCFSIGGPSHTSITMQAGQNASLSMKNPLIRQIIRWKSPDPTIASIDKNGTIRANRPGQVTLSGRSLFRIFHCRIQVIGFEKSSYTFAAGTTQDLSALFADPQSMYISSNPKTASITPQGILRGIAPGHVTILCREHGKIVSCKVRILGLTPANGAVMTGSDLTLRVSGYPSTRATGWTSSDPSVATVDKKGKVTGIKIGHTTITCTTKENLTLKTTVHVLSLKEEEVYLKKDENYQIKIKGNTSSLSKSWSSSDDKIATVDANGTVTANRAGKAKIHCQVGSGKVSCTVHVMSMQDTLVLNQMTPFQLNVKNGGEDITWSSSKEEIVTIEDGLVTGMAPGTAVITAKTRGYTFTCNVAVLSIEDTSLLIKEGDSYQVKIDGLSNVEKLLALKKDANNNTKIQEDTPDHSTAPNTENSSKNSDTPDTNDSSESSGTSDTETTASSDADTNSADEKTLFIDWSSEDTSIAAVSENGTITAHSAGRTTISCTIGSSKISVYVTVIGSLGTGNSCEFSLLTQTGDTRTYTLFKQNAHNYSSYDSYLAWHGCATCSLASVLGAYNSSYAGIRPDAVISGVEKKVADSSAWNLEHRTKALRQQMPLSLNGISQILKDCNIDNTYIETYSYSSGQEDIIAHLKTGNPVIFEVRQKSNQTGKSSQRWTNSYHTMIFLGILTNGQVIVADSVDRSWYSGGQRAKIVNIDDVMEYMFPCTSSTNSIYYDGASSDGGYIKINE